MDGQHIVDLKLFKKYKKSHKQFVGLKFFNVYGPNEYHKNEMKSIVLQTFENKKKRTNKTFKSHHKNYKDGCQLRFYLC